METDVQDKDSEIFCQIVDATDGSEDVDFILMIFRCWFN